LQRERHSLSALLRPPSISSIKSKPPDAPSSEKQNAQELRRPARPEREVDTSLLDPSQQAILASLEPGPGQQHDSQPGQESAAHSPRPIPPSTVSSRLSRITTGLAPTLDTFAAGIHDVDLYRAMGDTVSSRVLRICSERLEERDARNALRRLAIEGKDEEEDPRIRPATSREDLGVILGALSRVERR
jgi:kinetochore protein Mis13/DSN1